LIALEISAVDVGDFKFAAFRRLEARGNFNDLTIVKIKSGDGVADFGCFGFSSMLSALPWGSNSTTP
jgi:hypothetical protein